MTREEKLESSNDNFLYPCCSGLKGEEHERGCKSNKEVGVKSHPEGS
jgi:hypothetical protein